MVLFPKPNPARRGCDWGKLKILRQRKPRAFKELITFALQNGRPDERIGKVKQRYTITQMEERHENRSWKRPEKKRTDFDSDYGFRREAKDPRPYRRQENQDQNRQESDSDWQENSRQRRPRIHQRRDETGSFVRESSRNSHSNRRNDFSDRKRNSFGRERRRSPFDSNRTEGAGFDRERRNPFDRRQDRYSSREDRYSNRSGRFSDRGDRCFDKEESYFDRRDPRSRRRDERSDYDFWDRKSRRGGDNCERKPYHSERRGEKLADQDGLIRLNKFISNAGVCSRREADVLISSGVVTVNGEVITQMGYKVKATDEVCYDGEKLSNERKVYLLLNKPKGFITTVSDPQDRKTVMSLVGKACTERIYPVGRLDRNTSGLLLFTNDGELTKKLTHPSFGARKIYHVELDKALTKADMEALLEGIELEDGVSRVDDVQYVENANSRKVVGVELHSGKNRIVRRMFNHLGYNVEKLDRVCFAGLTKKDLPRGHYRFLTAKEVAFLEK